MAHYLKSGVTLPPDTKFNSSNRGYPDISAVGQNISNASHLSPSQTSHCSLHAPMLNYRAARTHSFMGFSSLSITQKKHTIFAPSTAHCCNMYYLLTQHSDHPERPVVHHRWHQRRRAHHRRHHDAAEQLPAQQSQGTTKIITTPPPPPSLLHRCQTKPNRNYQTSLFSLFVSHVY